MDKKLDRDLRAKLTEEERKNELSKDPEEKYISYLETAVIFFGTLGPLYFLFYLAYRIFMFSFSLALNMMTLPFSWILPIVHAAIWIAAIYSVYRKRSILDDLIKYL